MGVLVSTSKTEGLFLRHPALRQGQAQAGQHPLASELEALGCQGYLPTFPHPHRREGIQEPRAMLRKREKKVTGCPGARLEAGD